MKILISDDLSERGIEILQKEKDLTVDIKTDLGHEGLLKEIKHFFILSIRLSPSIYGIDIKV